MSRNRNLLFGVLAVQLRLITLGGIGIKGLMEKTKIAEKARVDCVFLGSVACCSHSLNPARWAVLDSGLGYETSAWPRLSKT